MADNTDMNNKKQKAQVFQEGDRTTYGYTNPIVYNETVKNSKYPVINSDVPATSKNLHSEEAMDYAANSFGEDLVLD